MNTYRAAPSEAPSGSPGVLDDFNVTNPRAVMAQVTAMGSTIRKLLLIVAVLATAIGGIVIMSVTLIGVSERRKEIGVRRAVGASRNAVLIQFLLEAVVLSFSGGSSALPSASAGPRSCRGFNISRSLLQPSKRCFLQLCFQSGLAYCSESILPGRRRPPTQSTHCATSGMAILRFQQIVRIAARNFGRFRLQARSSWLPR